MIASPPQSVLSPDAYRQQEQGAEGRHEYYNGLLHVMTGGSIIHNDIIINLIITLSALLQSRDFRVNANDLRVWIPESACGLYPDVILIQGQPEFTPNRTDEVINPHTVFEVLSKSTESYDRGKKFHLYRSLPSLQNYVLISQDSCQIEVFLKTVNGDWLLKVCEDLNDEIKLGEAITLPVAKIYRNIRFERTASNSEI